MVSGAASDMDKRHENLAALGLGGLGVLMGGVGVLLFSGRGRSILKTIAEKAWETPERLKVWNETAQRELERIQRALNHVAESIEAAR